MIYTLEQCRTRGSEHAAYQWSPKFGWDEEGSTSVAWTQEKRRAYLEGYYRYLGKEGDALTQAVERQLPFCNSVYNDGANRGE